MSKTNCYDIKSIMPKATMFYTGIAILFQKYKEIYYLCKIILLGYSMIDSPYEYGE